jgi:hypothetical protein
VPPCGGLAHHALQQPQQMRGIHVRESLFTLRIGQRVAVAERVVAAGE